MTGQFQGVDRFEIGLSYLPKPDFLAFSIPATHHTLITNDGSGLGAEVHKTLTANGNKVIVLNLPGIANPITENAVNLSAYSDEAVGQAIQEIQRLHGKNG